MAFQHPQNSAAWLNKAATPTGQTFTCTIHKGRFTATLHGHDREALQQRAARFVELVGLSGAVVEVEGKGSAAGVACC